MTESPAVQVLVLVREPAQAHAQAQEKKLFTDSTNYIELPSIFSQDIDNIEDWGIAELKY